MFRKILFQCVLAYVLRRSLDLHCVKSLFIQSFFEPHSVRMRENTDQKNFEYGHFSRSTYKYENLLVKG